MWIAALSLVLNLCGEETPDVRAVVVCRGTSCDRKRILETPKHYVLTSLVCFPYVRESVQTAVGSD